MKLKAISCLYILAVLGTVLFSSCQNFFKGDSLKDDITAAIEFAKAPKVTVNIELNRNVYGSISNQGAWIFREGQTQTLTFIINSDYDFDGWKILKDDTEVGVTSNKIMKDFPLSAWQNEYLRFDTTIVKIDGVRKTYNVDVTLLKAVDGLTIRPVCHSIKDVTGPQFYGNFLISGTLDDWNQNKYLDDFQPIFEGNVDFGENFVPDGSNVYNRSNGLYLSFGVKEEDSDDVHLKIYEYADYTSTSLPIWSDVPIVTEYKNLKKSGEGLFVNSGDYLYHELKSPSDVYIKVVFELEDSAGNICTSPLTYIIGKDTKCECDVFLESSFTGLNLSTFYLDDSSILPEDTLESVVKKFCTYKVYYSKNSELSCCGGARDKVSYSYFYSTDNVTFNLLDVKPLSVGNNSDYSKTIFGEIDFSNIDRNQGIYLKIVTTDTIGNCSSKIKYIPHSNCISSISSGSAIGDPDSIRLYGELDGKNSYSRKNNTYCFYSTDNSKAVKKVLGTDYRTLKITKNNEAKEYKVITVQGFDEKNYALISNMFSFSNKDIISSDFVDERKVKEINDYKIEYISMGRNSGLYELRAYSEELKNNCDYYELINTNIFCLYLKSQSSESQTKYSDNEGYVHFYNIPCDAAFYNLANFELRGVKDGEISHWEQVEFDIAIVEDDLVDNAPPQILTVDDYYISDDKQTTIPISTNQINFNDTHNAFNFIVSDRSSFALDKNGVGKVKIYYSSVQKIRSEEEIQQLPHFDIEYTGNDIKYDGRIYNNDSAIFTKKRYSMQLEVPLYNLGETEYQLYIYVEDNSTQPEGHNYCYKEINVNLGKEDFRDEWDIYKEGNDIVSVWESFGDCTISKTYSAYDDKTGVFEPSKNTFTENKFNRVVLKLEEADSYSYPIYFWPEAVTCNVKNIAVYNKKITIMYDQPCFVETVWSETNWGDSDSFAPEKWDYQTSEFNKVGIEVFKPAINGSGTMRNYDFEKEFYKFYDKKCYYCIIVHFADGTSMMSPIYKNE